MRDRETEEWKFGDVTQIEPEVKVLIDGYSKSFSWTFIEHFGTTNVINLYQLCFQDLVNSPDFEIYFMKLYITVS